MDYYSILGVSRDASDKEIKKAYKTQSMKHHPDRGGDEEQFKKVNEAYQNLSDPQKRAAYDNPQPQYNFNSQDFGGMGGFEDIFAHAFGRGFAQQRRHQNRDVQLQYTLELKDCFTGKTVTLQYQLPSGRNEIVEVNIPPGVKLGDVIRISNYGDDSIPNIPRGNLLLKVRINRIEGWDLDGLNLLHTTHVSVFDLITGAEKIITTPEGKQINLKIPKGTQPNTTFSIGGYGLPDSRSNHRGTIYVTIKGTVPKVNDSNILNQIEFFKSQLN